MFVLTVNVSVASSSNYPNHAERGNVIVRQRCSYIYFWMNVHKLNGSDAKHLEVSILRTMFPICDAIPSAQVTHKHCSNFQDMKF